MAPMGSHRGHLGGGNGLLGLELRRRLSEAKQRGGFWKEEMASVKSLRGEVAEPVSGTVRSGIWWGLGHPVDTYGKQE